MPLQPRHLRTDRCGGPRCHRRRALAFIVYSTWRAFANADHYAALFVSPVLLPVSGGELRDDAGRPNWEIFGSRRGLSPALPILIFRLGFRLTCYYYRKAYYWGLLGLNTGLRGRRTAQEVHGETRFLLILQNIHRYFFYVAVPAGVAGEGVRPDQRRC